MNTEPETPSVVILELPNELTVWNMLPTFHWTASTDYDPLDTVRYKLEVSLDSEFNFVSN